MSLTTIGGKAVSKLCLGTMTWGEQNTEAEAHQQIDCASDQGINFIDCAEMYPVPPNVDNAGTSETIIGSWMKKNSQRRHEWVISSKAAGPGRSLDYLRGGPKHNASYLTAAVDDSLKRMQCEYIDLYHLHWPERSTNIFGQLGYRHREIESTPIETTLRALETLIETGKIRAIGLSNETPWGVMRYLEFARQFKLPKIETIQNPYNLLNRTFEIGLAEIAMREDVGLMAYSPMAFGALSGKYRNNAHPANARLTKFERFTRYSNPESTAAINLYCELAQAWGIKPSQLALAFVNQQPFALSTIVGATSLQQLTENIASLELNLSCEQLKAIDKINTMQPNPAP